MTFALLAVSHHLARRKSRAGTERINKTILWIATAIAGAALIFTAWTTWGPAI